MKRIDNQSLNYIGGQAWSSAIYQIGFEGVLQNYVWEQIEESFLEIAHMGTQIETFYSRPQIYETN